MLGYLQRKRQAAAAAQAPPAGLPPPQVPNLYSSVQRYVPDVDDNLFNDTIKCFYEQLDQQTEKDFAQQLHDVLKDMRTQGDIAQAGPQFMLMEFGGGNLEIMHSLTMVPPLTEIPSSQLPPTSTFLDKKYPFVTAIGNREDQADSWMVIPVEPKSFFKERKGKLAKWAAFPQPAPNDNNPMAPTGASRSFYPVLPLVGKAMVQEAISCLYTTPKASLKTVAHKLAPYVDKITDADIKEKAQRSLLAMVTRRNKNGDTQAVIKINQTPITDAANLPLYNWMVPIVEQNLEPQLPSSILAGATVTAGGNNSTTGGSSNNPAGSNNNTPSTTSVGAGLPSTGRPLVPNGQNQTQNQTGLASISQPMASSGLNQPQTGLASHSQPMASNSLNQTQLGLASHSQTMASTSLNQTQTQTPSQAPTVGFANPVSTVVGGAPVAPPPPPPPPAAGGGVPNITLQNATPQQLAQAMMASMLGGGNIGPPPTKVPRVEEKVGFDNLPEMAKLAWMTYSCAVTEQGLEPEVLALMSQPKSTRLLYFDTHMLPDLRQKAPEAFGDFHLSAQALDDMVHGKFKPVSSTDNWWNGIVGHCLPRSREDIQAANRLYEQLRNDNGVQVQVTPGQVNKLSLRAPAPITSVYELLNFITRIIKLMNKLMPRSYYARFAVAGYKELTFNGRQKQLEQNAEWRRIKLPEIVYTFYLVANNFFGHILDKRDLSQGYCNWWDPRDESEQVQHFTSPTPRFVPDVMPLELRPQQPLLTTIPRQPAIGNHHQYQGGYQRNLPSGRNNGNTNNNTNHNGNNNNTGNNNNNNNNNNNSTDGINRRFHPLLQEFWSTVPENRRNIGLRPYCQAAGTSVSRFVLQLGLQRDDCGLFHGTGNCVLAASGNCRNRHVARDLNRNNVQQAVNTLRQGLQQMN